MKNKYWMQSGQTLIEAIVALSVMLIIIAAVAVTVVNGLYNSQFIKNQNLANKYAQQAMEQVRFIQSNSLTTFSGFGDVSYCYGNDEQFDTQGSQDTCAPNVGSPATHKRTVAFDKGISPCQTSETKVTVTDSWSSSKCSSTKAFCHSVVLVSCLAFQTTDNP